MKSMILYSIKQLFRQKLKTALLFLLVSLSAALLVFSSVRLLKTEQQVKAALNQFLTIGMVTQEVSDGETILKSDILDFEGAGYIQKPETRPYYLARTEDIEETGEHNHFMTASGNKKIVANGIHIVEFTALEDFQDVNTPVMVRVNKDLYNVTSYAIPNSLEQDLKEGTVFYLSEGSVKVPTKLEKGKRYIANVQYDGVPSQLNGKAIYWLHQGPFSSRRDPDTCELVDSSIFPAVDLDARTYLRADEVTEDFWEPGHMGDVWLEWVEQYKLWDWHWLPVMPTASLELIPTFHKKNVYIKEGRAITEEEFNSGACVCLLPDKLLRQNKLSIGDKITLPMTQVYYGYKPDMIRTFEFGMLNGCSPLDEFGEPYDVFFEAEYEIVGTYRVLAEASTELFTEVIVVPSASVTETGDENIVYWGPMNNWGTSFQIPSDKKEEFDRKLHEAVPEAASLKIQYDDNGYAQVMQSLETQRLSMWLLFAGSVVAVLAVFVMIVYFFVVRERKRTAIERSLGMTGRQCRVSLMAGVLILAVAAVSLGSAAGWALFSRDVPPSAVTVSSESEDGQVTDGEEMEETVPLSRDFSLWARNTASEADLELSEEDMLLQEIVLFAVPVCMVAALIILLLFSIQQNLKIDPILLLSDKGE